MSFTTTFGNSPVSPQDVAFAAYTFSANTALYWPQFSAGQTNVAARFMNITASTTGLSFSMPDCTLNSVGYDAIIYNAGGDSFNIVNFTTGAICTIAPGIAYYLMLTTNATQAGTWQTVQFGAGTSSASAAALAGAGLLAAAGLLEINEPASLVSSNFSIPTSSRGTLQVWNGGSGTITLPASGSAGNGWVIAIANNGSGVLTLATTGGDQIDGGATSSYQISQSAFIVCTGSSYFSVGKGIQNTFAVSILNLNVAGSANVTLTSTQAQNIIQQYTGALTGNISVFVPTTPQIYFVYNNTTGSYTLTVSTSGGSGISVPQGSHAILYCDGTNVVSAFTSSVGTTISVLPGSAASPSVNFQGSVTTGLYSPNTNQAAISANTFEVMQWNSTSSAVNYAVVTNSNTGSAISIAAAGTDSSINFAVLAKGTGVITCSPIVSSGAITAAGVVTGTELVVGTPGFSDINILEQLTTSAANYVQIIVQNQSTAAAASADMILSNNLGTSSTYYADVGINSSGFTGSGSLNIPNASYFYSANGDLVLGSSTNNPIHFVINGSAVDAMTISTSGNVSMTNSATVSGSLNANSVTVSGGTATVGVSSATTGAIVLYGSSSGSATITVATAAGSATLFQLPNTNGSNTNVLTTNGSGVLSWSAARTTVLNAQVFTLSGTFTAPAAATVSTVYKATLIAGGGGGGGGTSSSFGSSGGGAGGCSIYYASGLTAGATCAITIGTGGGGGVNGNNGTAGVGSTAVFGGTTISASGGSPGNYSASASVPPNPGAGGIGSNGTLNLQGGAGGYAVGYALSGPQESGGKGGDSFFGGGGVSPIGATNNGISAAANSGGGGSGSTGAGNATGGTGAAGVCWIEWVL